MTSIRIQGVEKHGKNIKNQNKIKMFLSHRINLQALMKCQSLMPCSKAVLLREERATNLILALS